MGRKNNLQLTGNNQQLIGQSYEHEFRCVFKIHRLKTDVCHKKRAESAFKTARFQRASPIRHRFLTDDALHAIALTINERGCDKGLVEGNDGFIFTYFILYSHSIFTTNDKECRFMKFQGLIFDFNGVLWWDTHLQEFAWKQFSEQIRGVSLSSEEITIHLHGRNNQYTLEYLTGNSVIGNELEYLTQQKEGIYRKLCLKQESTFKLSPGAIELLDYLVAQHIEHTIATASEKTNLDFFVEHLSLEKWFDLKKVVYDDGLRPSKPAPDSYLEAANRLGLNPAQCIVVEDSYSGIEAAHAAGIGHIIALGPVNTHHQLSELDGVNSIVESLADIPKELLF